MDLTRATLGPYAFSIFEYTHNTKAENGETNPTVNGSAAELINPVSFEVKRDPTGPLANS